MRLAEFRYRVERDLEYPVDRRTVIDRLGNLELAAPGGDSETVEQILERTDDDTFRSSDEVYLGVIGNVGDPFVGRKHYDDRGRNPVVEQWSF